MSDAAHYEYGYAFAADEKVVLVTWQSYMDKPIHQVMFNNRYD
ncbi:hypothetical protein PZB74_18790 [Porifericola rhodea]|nr:hypothetical protein [Porifericola rhodea]WKN30999.1 hypothetical protein PZB74_18790 [Porifericola rhodea]